MSNVNTLECNWCKTTTQVYYCKDCTILQCSNCTGKRTLAVQHCQSCDLPSNSPICATCGGSCEVVDHIEHDSCANCLGVELLDPETILQSLPSNYFSTVAKIKDIVPVVSEINNTFDFFISLVRQCRMAGLLAFPQIESRLTRCAKGMEQINRRTIDHLGKVKREALFEVFNMSYFKDMDISRYRSADRLINNLGDSIEQSILLVNRWCSQVTVELKNLYKLSEPLRKHYVLLQQISTYLPQHIHSIAGVVPPVSVKLKQNKSTHRGEMFMIFASQDLVFLDEKSPDNALLISFPYRDVRKFKVKKSSVKGHSFEIKFGTGEAVISAPPPVLRGIQHYFDLIDTEESLMIGSAKSILKIEANLPDKNEIKRACDKFIDIFRERLFGANTPETQPTMSMTDFRRQFKYLKRSSDELDDKAKRHKINLEDYRQYRNEINESLRRLRQNFSDVGGHFFNSGDLSKWISSTDFGNEDDEEDSFDTSSQFPSFP